MSKEARKDLTYYLGLRYPVQLVESDEGGFFAKVPDLPGCMSQGETQEEALANVREARGLWLEDAVEAGDEIPEPATAAQYSGRFLARVPRSLHERLARAAERDGISLNQLVVSLLAAGSVTWEIDARLARIEDCMGSVRRELHEGLGKPGYRLNLIGPREPADMRLREYSRAG